MPEPHPLLYSNLDATIATMHACRGLAEPVERAADLIGEALLNGRTLLACGNGGSAGDAAHLTSEIANRYVLERRGYPAIDLTADHNALTAVINDYPPRECFARLLRAHGRAGDVLAVFSTSGGSENIRLALEAARDLGITSVAFLGKGGGACRGLANVELIVPGDVTARVQEAHLVLYHTICELLDPRLAEANVERA